MASDTVRRMMEKMEKTFRDLENTFRDFERDFDRQFSGPTSQFESPVDRLGNSFPVDVEETDNQITVKADLPGVEKDNITVNATEQTVNIQATDEREVTEEGKNYYRQERQQQNYQRTISLPDPVDPESAKATYENGVLTVMLDTVSGNGTTVSIE